MNDKPTICVRGLGRATMPPDRTVISFKLTALKEKYADSVHDLNHRVETLRDQLVEAGIARDALKTTTFRVVPEHDWQGEHKNRKLSFLGWRSAHAMRLELPVDRELTNRALIAIESGDIESEIDVTFEVGDKDALRALVLEDATRSASRHAATMAKAAGCTLGAPIRIEYDWAEVRLGTMRRGLTAGAGPDMEPQDVRHEDTVTVIFELER